MAQKPVGFFTATLQTHFYSPKRAETLKMLIFVIQTFKKNYRTIHYCESLKGLDTEQSSADPSRQLHLPSLPGPLYHLNCRTLQSVLTAVAKDMEVDLSGDVPEWWPANVLFCNPRKRPRLPNGKYYHMTNIYSIA